MRGVYYFIASLVAVVVLGFAFSGVRSFVARRADKMGRGHKKREEIELWRK
jgi:hypothetical protein